MAQAGITSRVPESEIDKAAAELGLTAVENAYYNEAGELVLVAGGDSFAVPLPALAEPVRSAGRTDTLPRSDKRRDPRGSAQPAFAADAPPNPVGRTPTEGPVPPQGPGPSPTKATAAEGRTSRPSALGEATAEVDGAAANCQAERSLAADPSRSAVIPSEVEESRLDDFTAIDGVGPVTAAKLHDAGFHTYDDINDRIDFVDDVVGKAAATRIRAWLHARKT